MISIVATLEYDTLGEAWFATISIHRPQSETIRWDGWVGDATTTETEALALAYERAAKEVK